MSSRQWSSRAENRLSYLVCVVFIALIGSDRSYSQQASTVHTLEVVGPEEPETDLFSATFSRGFAITHDNDLFAQETDRDYTGGIHFSFPGTRNARVARFGFRALKQIDKALGLPESHLSESAPRSSVIRLGLLIFTPEDIENFEPIHEDRPYANLAYAEFSQFSIGRSGKTVDHSSLTIGLLGSGIAEALQKAIHSNRDLAMPNGYQHQISDGGELTARYARGRYQHVKNGPSYDVTLGYQAGVGYTVDATAGVNLRLGRRVSPWWVSLSDFAERVNRASPTFRAHPGNGHGDLYLSAGIGLRLQAYNALLQGQWRDSEVTASASSLNKLLLEAWLGVTSQIRNIRIEYKVRFRSAELKHGPYARDQLWGGLTVQRAF